MCSFEWAWINEKKMQKNAENGSDGEVQTADVKFCKNWYVCLLG